MLQHLSIVGFSYRSRRGLNLRLLGRQGSGGGGACAQDPHHPHIEECEVSGEGLRGPDQGSQGQGPEGEGTCAHAHQGPQDYH